MHSSRKNIKTEVMFAALARLIARTSAEFAAERCGVPSKYIKAFSRGERKVYPRTMRGFENWYHLYRRKDTAAWWRWKKMKREINAAKRLQTRLAAFQKATFYGHAKWCVDKKRDEARSMSATLADYIRECDSACYYHIKRIDNRR